MQEQSMSSDTGASGRSAGSDSPDEYEEMQKFQAGETRNVVVARRFVVGSLLLVGAFVSALVYILLRQRTDNDATDAFELFSSSIEATFKFQVESIFTANRALSRAITSSAFALEMNFAFPLFSVPAFESLAYEARLQAGFEVVMYAPISNQLESWYEFANESRGWLDTSKYLYDNLQPGENRSAEPPVSPLPNTVWDIDEETDGFYPRTKGGFFVPLLHVSPPPVPELPIYQNINLFSSSIYSDVGTATIKLKDAVFSPFDDKFATYVDSVVGQERHSLMHEDTGSHMLPHSIAAQPVYKNFERKLDGSLDTVIGYLFSVISWDTYLDNLLPQGINGIVAVLRNSCNQSYTFEINGQEAVLVQEGDVHDTKFDALVRTVTFEENYLDPNMTSDVPGHCQIFLDLYSSEMFEESYKSYLPIVLTLVVGILFLFMAGVFATYDIFVQTRNERVLGAAAQSNAIVSKAFPSNIRKQLMEQNANGKRGTVKGFLSADDGNSNDTEDVIFTSKPIADFFPECTVLFADIAGFTAWSSVREPTQVFQLLETIYLSFDKIAKRRCVFKVETVGDCYVAVCGLPTPYKDHAIRMARFAQDSLKKMKHLVKQLEVTLGPDTSDLSMRIGLHSGPVTAGVLRGDNMRFQLFGDTVNSCSRIESTGKANKIHLSQATADLIISAGKIGWVSAREDKVYAKGLGTISTFWLSISPSKEGSEVSGSNNLDLSLGDQPVEKPLVSDGGAVCRLPSKKDQRLIEWNVEILLRVLKQIVARRQARGSPEQSPPGSTIQTSIDGKTVIDEVAEVITLPKFDHRCSQSDIDPNKIELDDKVVEQVRAYITRVSSGYRDNPFHNFKHASHVTMSVVKLLSRIVAPSEIDMQDSADAVTMHDHTYGITSDPLTQFSCLFSAIIHDLDHPGVPNTTLVNEETEISSKYKGKSIAEQNSVDIAWSMLMSDDFADFRAAIYASDEEKVRFRQLIVNSVMATDIVDKELKALRNARWERAFSGQESSCKKEAVDRKATIVIEHLIQASDIAHTMQHWHIYRSWNERLFMEMYRAFKQGRSDTDPSKFWYKGEIGFFDFYIIPLAKKLKDCGVFGVSCHEFLNYANQNRNEWIKRGEEVVAELIKKVSEDESIQQISGGSIEA